jgi:hypothetical protein
MASPTPKIELYEVDSANCGIIHESVQVLLTDKRHILNKYDELSACLKEMHILFDYQKAYRQELTSLSAF